MFTVLCGPPPYHDPSSEVDGEVFEGVVKDKKQAEEEFRMTVTRGRTAGTVVQRYRHTHMDTPTMTCIIETDAPTIAYVYSAAPNFPTPWCIRDIPHSPKHDGLAVAVHGIYGVEVGELCNWCMCVQ